MMDAAAGTADRADAAADDVAAMLRDSAAGFLAEHHSLPRLRAVRDLPDGLDRGVLHKMAELGWLGLRLPESLGGAGLGLRAVTALSELFGEALLPEPFVAAAVLPAVVLAAVSDSLLRTRLAAQVAAGEGPVALAVQEAANQVEPGLPATRLDTRGNRLALHGTKLFAPGGAGTYLVSAALDGRTALVAVSAGAPGLRAVPARLTDGTVAATLHFDAAAVEDDAILLRDAGPAIRRALDEGTVATAAQVAGVGNAAMALTLRYLGQRQQFGRAIGSFQALQHRAVDLRLQAELAGAAWRNALRRMEADPDAPATAAAVSAAKARCSDAALATCRACIQFHGAIGYTEEADIGLYLKTAMRLASTLGNGTAHRERFFRLHRQQDTNGKGHA